MIKSTAIDASVVGPDGVYRKVGPARVFTSEREATAAIKGRSERKIQPGDVIVLMCRGPLGAGMEEIYQITSALRYLKWGKDVAVITDARFSGVSTGACIGHVGPEALAGGPIGKVRDGDLIEIVIDRTNLTGSINFVGTAEKRLEPDSRGPSLGRAKARLAPRTRSRSSDRHATVGLAAASQRRHVGWLRLRSPRDRGRAATGLVLG